MNEIDRIIGWYREGVSFVCGCRVNALHAAVVRALQTGKLPVEALYRCPLHGAGVAMLPAQAS